ncbi:hypothetical protein [Nocardiopsis eucommiae]|uniref:hypothetical protein n=1 Tax=Nocardiopsis eucommiae TaxID=2831970 RepID=UPI003D765E49
MTAYRIRRQGRVRLNSTLPSGIPGVDLRMRGTAWYRCGQGKLSLSERSVARAATVVAVQGIAQRVEHRSFPDIDRDLQERVTLELVSWQRAASTIHPDLSVCARVRLRLSAASRKRLAEYDAARRQAHIERAMLSDQATHLCRHILHDADIARAWWLQHHDASIESWEKFNSVILPLVRKQDDPQSRYTRAASLFASLIERMETDETRFQAFLNLARALVDQMNWQDLASKPNDPPVPPTSDRRNSRAGHN